MDPKPTYIISDLHLGAVPREREQSFIRWLSELGPGAAEVVINGDLFDFWFEYRSAIPRGHTRVLGALAELVDAGTPIRFMGGNHDWWGGSYLRDEIGMTLHHDPVVVTLGGRRTLLAHGDGIGQGDLGYRALKLVLRSRPTRWAFRWLHPDVGARIAGGVSMTEERAERHQVAAGAPSERQLRRSAILEGWATEKLRAEPELEMVALGHTHLPRLVEVEPGRFYVNGGDWVTHRSYVVLTPGQAPRIDEWKD